MANWKQNRRKRSQLPLTTIRRAKKTGQSRRNGRSSNKTSAFVFRFSELSAERKTFLSRIKGKHTSEEESPTHDFTYKRLLQSLSATLFSQFERTRIFISNFHIVTLNPIAGNKPVEDRQWLAEEIGERCCGQNYNSDQVSHKQFI